MRSQSRTQSPQALWTIVGRLERPWRSQSRTQSPQALWPVVGRQETRWRIRKKIIFLIGCPVTSYILLPQKSCGNKILVPQIESLLATNHWSKSLRTLDTGLWGNRKLEFYYRRIFAVKQCKQLHGSHLLN